MHVERFENFKKFLGTLDNPENKIPLYIHVTGTSGKGSTCIMLASILKFAGHKVGMMTSPHLTEITERWQINGKQMTKKDFVRINNRIQKAANKFQKSSNSKLTFFDLTTAIGLTYFAEKKVAWAVIEVGCGGRYDSTNAIPRKEAAVITNVDLDHTNILGKTRAKIAYEKAGIIKKGCVVFTGEQNPKILKIFKVECRKEKISLKVIKKTKQFKYSIPVIGTHQIANARLAVETMKYLKIQDKKIRTGLARAKFPVRLEVVSKNPYIILDGAHNAHEIKVTCETIKTLNYENLFLLIAFSEGKNVKKMIAELVRLKPTTVACTKQRINPFRKAIPTAVIAKEFMRFGIKTQGFSRSKSAFERLKKQMGKKDILLVTGSMFLAGELRRELTF